MSQAHERSVEKYSAALTLFEQSEHAGVWPYLSKATILAEMRSHINQAYSPFVSQQFSGPAAIAIALVHQDPCRYVRLCHSLYETGGFQIPYGRVQALPLKIYQVYATRSAANR